MGSKTEVDNPTDADGSNPKDPVITLASSERISPNIFSVTITSNLLGFCINCIAALSTNIKSTVISLYAFAVSVAVSRHSLEVARTLALSTTVILRVRDIAYHRQVLQHALSHTGCRHMYHK